MSISKHVSTVLIVVVSVVSLGLHCVNKSEYFSTGLPLSMNVGG